MKYPTIVYESVYQHFQIVEWQATEITDKSVTLIAPASRWQSEHTFVTSRESVYGDYWLTREEAVKALMEHAEQKIKMSAREITKCQAALEKLKTQTQQP